MIKTISFTTKEERKFCDYCKKAIEYDSINRSYADFFQYQEFDLHLPCYEKIMRSALTTHD